MRPGGCRGSICVPPRCQGRRLSVQHGSRLSPGMMTFSPRAFDSSRDTSRCVICPREHSGINTPLRVTVRGAHVRAPGPSEGSQPPSAAQIRTQIRCLSQEGPPRPRTLGSRPVYFQDAASGCSLGPHGSHPTFCLGAHVWLQQSWHHSALPRGRAPHPKWTGSSSSTDRASTGSGTWQVQLLGHFSKSRHNQLCDYLAEA